MLCCQLQPCRFGVLFAGRCYKSHSLSNTLKSCPLLCELCLVARRRGSSCWSSRRSTSAPRLGEASVEPAIFPPALNFHRYVSAMSTRRARQRSLRVMRCGAHRRALFRPHQPVSSPHGSPPALPSDTRNLVLKQGVCAYFLRCRARRLRVHAPAGARTV